MKVKFGHIRIFEFVLSPCSRVGGTSKTEGLPKAVKEHLRKQEDAKKHCEEKIREYIEARAGEIERHR
ncbi:MAG: hypothetical protein ABSA81_02030 [Candidatus Bathyarchaeia archaeon]